MAVIAHAEKRHVERARHGADSAVDLRFGFCRRSMSRHQWNEMSRGGLPAQQARAREFFIAASIIG